MEALQRARLCACVEYTVCDKSIVFEIDNETGTRCILYVFEEHILHEFIVYQHTTIDCIAPTGFRGTAMDYSCLSCSFIWQYEEGSQKFSRMAGRPFLGGKLNGKLGVYIHTYCVCGGRGRYEHDTIKYLP